VSVSGLPRQIVALKLDMAAGHTDTVIYQSEPGVLKLPDGTETDARYALLRQNAKGEIIEADACRATYLKSEKFSATMPGDLTGTIVDILGDLTGTRHESALVIKPDKPWPAGENLKGRQLLIRVESSLRDACNEGYRIEKVSDLPGGLVRVDLQDYAPFVTSWHEVTELPADKPNVIRTWRPMADHGNNPWYCGMKLWFPERGKTYTIKQVNPVGGGFGGDTVELVESVNPPQADIRVGDWYVIYAVWPGLRVSVANDFCWRQESARGWRQYSLRATGTVTVRSPATTTACWHRAGAGQWQESPAGRETFSGAEAGDKGVSLIMGKPPWLNLDDPTPPALVRVTLDDMALDAQSLRDLGWIEPPRKATFEFRDAENPLDIEGTQVALNGKRMLSLVKATTGAEGKAAVLEVDLEKALAAEKHQARRHVLEVTVPDMSVDRRQTSIVLSFIAKVPLDPSALYLSDLKPVKAFAHGGLIRDKDYVGNVAQIAGRVYPKCLTLCPEVSPDGNHAEVIYALPGDRGPLSLKADIGISDSGRGNGSATFTVQRSDTADGPWDALFTSPVLRGGQAPLTLELPLGPAKYLRLYTTDAGDSINSDHAVWGDARLK